MPSSRLVRTAAIALVLFGYSRSAAAQLYEAVGTRAQGMGGAFVAVADDATATWWNPAGLASGTLLSVVFEKTTTSGPRNLLETGPARREGASGIAMSFPSLGLSYYRLRVSEIAPVSTSVAGDEAGREDQAAATVAVHTMALNQFGATVGQSISEHFVIATTAKLMRAASAAGAVAGAEDPLTVLDELDPPADTFGDLDIGAMAQYGVLRVGLSVKHVFAPEFGDGANRRQLERQARAGVAVLTSPQGVLSAFTVAFDADLTKTETVAGDVRHMAIGVEAWLAQKWLGVRTGLSRSTTGPSRTTGSVGASVGGIYGLYGNASVLFGGDPSRTGWSASVSLTF